MKRPQARWLGALIIHRKRRIYPGNLGPTGGVPGGNFGPVGAFGKVGAVPPFPGRLGLGGVPGGILGLVGRVGATPPPLPGRVGLGGVPGGMEPEPGVVGVGDDGPPG